MGSRIWIDKLFRLALLRPCTWLLYTIGLHLMVYNKLLNFVPATNNVASTGLPALRQPISNALDF